MIPPISRTGEGYGRRASVAPTEATGGVRLKCFGHIDRGVEPRSVLFPAFPTAFEPPPPHTQ